MPDFEPCAPVRQELDAQRAEIVRLTSELANMEGAYFSMKSARDQVDAERLQLAQQLEVLQTDRDSLAAEFVTLRNELANIAALTSRWR